MEFLEDHEVHRQCHSSIGALLGMEPPIRILRTLAVIGTDIDELRAVVACFDHEVSIGSSRHRDVRAPAENVVGVIPCLRLGYVRLLSKSLRGRRGKVAIPIVERKSRPTDERQIANASTIGHHGIARDRREACDAVGAVFLDRVEVGGRYDLGRLIPARAN